MSGACGTVNPDALIRSLIGMTDCRTAALGGDGWHGLATSGLFAATLTGLLTIAVAREGYRLLAGGGSLLPADAVALLIRFGFVIALATSWPAYDRLVYRVAMQGPAELADVMFPAAGIETGSLVDRLQNAYDAIDTVPPARPAAATAPANTAARPPAAGGSEMPVTVSDGLPGSGRHAAAGILAVTGAGSWIAARFVLGLLLAIGPLAMAAWLFETAQGLFVGWLRALVGAALACLVIPLSLSLELQALAGPVVAAARAGTADVPGLGAIVWIFALVDVALIVAVQRMAGGLDLPARVERMIRPRGPAAADADARSPAPAFAVASAPRAAQAPVPLAPSRAQAIARAAQARILVPGDGPARARATPAPALPAPMGAAVEIRRGTQFIDSARRSAAGRRAVPGKRLDLPS
ncbi:MULTISPECIES: type IV secretion system protein [unclassified Sphingomonas]|uniref:type IV secretion system protein n=1 Tax=unclassified Sphingomonas TaxID=196159 RepID=UPI0022698F83|nr:MULTISPECIES: type IV secretion system protein [unclassified Sphingomonas]